jgi:hypothetical protein
MTEENRKSYEAQLKAEVAVLTEMVRVLSAKIAEMEAKQEQGEPVGVAHLMQEGFTHCIWSEYVVPVGTKLYTTPQQRTWVELTEQEQGAIMEDLNAHGTRLYELAAAIEAKLKDKNDPNGT